MKPFREFHKDRVGCWPGQTGDFFHNIFNELCESMAEYVEQAVKELREEDEPR